MSSSKVSEEHWLHSPYSNSRQSAVRQLHAGNTTEKSEAPQQRQRRPSEFEPIPEH